MEAFRTAMSFRFFNWLTNNRIGFCLSHREYTNLPDKRLNQRLIKIVEQASAQPEASVPQASGDWANTKATYYFWNSERFSSEDIIDGHRRSTAQRASQEDVILGIQDTSDFNFTHHKGKTWDKGFGQTCSQKYVRGLKVHSTLAVSSQGVPLGIGSPVYVVIKLQ
jgi:hypothetical protein